jgi:hypothetical protein
MIEMDFVLWASDIRPGGARRTSVIVFGFSGLSHRTRGSDQASRGGRNGAVAPGADPRRVIASCLWRRGRLRCGSECSLRVVKFDLRLAHRGICPLC